MSTCDYMNEGQKHAESPTLYYFIYIKYPEQRQSAD